MDSPSQSRTALREEIEELKKKLTEEKLSNMELDLSNNDQTKKVTELERRIKRTEDSLVSEKFKTQNLRNQIQQQSEVIEYYESVIAEHEDKSREHYESIIAELQEQIQSLHLHIVKQNNVIIQQQQRQQQQQGDPANQHSRPSQPLSPRSPSDPAPHSHSQSPGHQRQEMKSQPASSSSSSSSSSSTGRRSSFSRPWDKIPDHDNGAMTSSFSAKQSNGDDEFDKIPDDVLKIEDHDADDSESELSDTMQLRHRLLEEQMKHENTKHKHRESIYQLEQLETIGGSAPDDVAEINERLQEEVETLREQLENERRKREHLDKERRNSLAALSQNMFKKLLDSEHQHYDDKSDLEGQCQQLKSVVRHLEMSKQVLLKETSTTIDDLRQHIKLLARRLQKYENWD